MSFLIPTDRFGTKHKPEQRLSKENIKQRKENTYRAHTIKSVKKNRQKIDQQAQIRINDIRRVMEKYQIQYVKNTGLIAALSVQNKIFEDARIAKIFIESFKEKIFS